MTANESGSNLLKLGGFSRTPAVEKLVLAYYGTELALCRLQYGPRVFIVRTAHTHGGGLHQGGPFSPPPFAPGSIPLKSKQCVYVYR